MNTLCVTGEELILSESNPNGVVTKSNYDAWVRRRKVKKFSRSCFGQPVRITLDSVPAPYREAWIKKNCEGCAPETPSVKDGFTKQYETDAAAATFFKNYHVDYGDKKNGTGLPDERQEEYVFNASVLNAVARALHANQTGRKKMRMPKELGFWESAAAAMRRFHDMGVMHTLPENPRRLRDRYVRYQKGGYETLIHKNYANANAVKITDEAGEWLVAQWMSQIERATIEQLHARYNEKALEMNEKAGREIWKMLNSSNSIRNYLYHPEVERIWHAARYGELSAKEKYSRQNRTILPSRRDSLWYSDGTKLNYFYLDEAGRTKTCNVYEVMDAYSECFLGYHISASEDYEAQYCAYRMAVKFSEHKPYEIRYDNQGGHKRLENSDLLKNLSRLAIRTAPYNGKSKTIERAFGEFQSQYLHKDWFFSGQNITARKKESRANMEFILANNSNLPTLDEVKEAYRKRRDEWNAAAHPKTGISRKEMYLTSENEKSQKAGILELIDLFGVTTPEARRYTASGIELEVKGVRYAFEVLTADGTPDRDFNRRNIGRRFYRRYQPDDLSIISLYEDSENGKRFVAFAQPYKTVHRAIQDQTNKDLVRIRQLQELNKKERIEDELKRSRILEKHGLHPHQHGLNVAPLKGVTTGRRQAKNVGQYLKEESELTALAQDERARRKVVRDAAKEEKQRALEAENDYMEFLLRKRELEIISGN